MDWVLRPFRDPEFEKKREFLAKLPLFRGVRSRQFGALLRALYPRTYQKGEVLFLEGDIGRALFILESGKVEVFKNGPDGAPQRIAEMGPGDYFGEMALLEERPRLASAVASEESQILLLYKAKLESLYSDAPRIALAIMAHIAQLLSGRLRTTTEKLMVRPVSEP
jgi:CRP/FNR family transcriptional regulator, cyclic AMP receptor protein